MRGLSVYEYNLYVFWFERLACRLFGVKGFRRSGLRATELRVAVVTIFGVKGVEEHRQEILGYIGQSRCVKPY